MDFWKPRIGKVYADKYILSSSTTQEHLTRTRHENSTKPWTVLHFFFDFRAAGTMSNTQEGMYRSLLYQVMCALPFGQETLEKYKLDLEHLLITNLEDQTIQTIFKILRLEDINVLLLIDGLDDSQSNVRILIQSIRKFRGRTSIRMCLASRPEPLITALLNDCASLKIQDHNATGIEAYVQRAFRDMESVFSLQLIASDKLIKTVLRRANGTWLWVHFAVELLLQCLVRGFTEAEAWSAVEQLPSQLSNMYARLFEQIPSICRPEAALVLIILENAKHTVTLAQLYRIWSYVTHKLGFGGGSKQNLTLEQFRNRLQGFLSGLLDFKPFVLDDLVSDQAPYDRYNFDLEALDAPSPGSLMQVSPSSVATHDIEQDAPFLAIGDLTNAGYEGFAALPSTLPAGEATHRALDDPTAINMEEVRLLHETLRTFLREGKPMNGWLGNLFWNRFPNRIWLRVHIEIVETAVSTLSEPWSFVCHVCDKSPTHGNSITNSALWAEFVRDFFPTTGFDALLCDSIVAIMNVARSEDIVDPDMLRRLSNVLRSPFMMVQDFLKDRFDAEAIHNKIKAMLPTVPGGNEIRCQDLALAATCSWVAYFENSSTALSSISTLEKNYILSCMLDGLVGFRRKRVIRQAGFLRAQEQILGYLIGDGPIESHHAAMYLVSVGYEQPPSFLSTDAIQNTRDAQQPIKEVVKSGTLECWPFLQREGMHLLEIWADIPTMSFAALKARLEFLAQIGVNIHGFRNRHRGNLVHLVTDSYAGGRELRNVIIKLRVLKDQALDFFHTDNAGRTGLQRIRRLVWAMEQWKPTYSVEESRNYGEEIYTEALVKLLDELISDRSSANRARQEHDLHTDHVHPLLTI